MHFWHPDLTTDVHDEELHDHRYNFSSKVLRGTLTHECYEFDGTSDQKAYELVPVDCTPNSEPLRPIASGVYNSTSKHVMAQGSEYTIATNTLHRITATHAVTLLKRGEKTKSHANVARPINTQAPCPFSKSIDEDKLWEYIAECCTGFANGYHTYDIPRGVVGDSSKILEEVLELQDAELQNNTIMGLLEVTDLYGAMMMYLAKNHPETSIEDIHIMALATKRAFENGDR